MTIKSNALFIADVHFNSLRKNILPLLYQIKDNQLEVSQLFLMGDIFDFLCGGVQHFYDTNIELISLLNDISKDIETIYFEGNHDYNLKTIFPKIKVFQRSQQPQQIILNGKKTALSHGDIFTPKGYDIYSAIIRNKALLKFLNFLNINNWLSTIVIKKLEKKQICSSLENFEQFKTKRIESYKCDLVIEGHFHQGFLDENYINIPSFACEQKYMIYKDQQFKFIKVQ